MAGEWPEATGLFFDPQREPKEWRIPQGLKSRMEMETGIRNEFPEMFRPRISHNCFISCENKTSSTFQPGKPSTCMDLAEPCGTAPSRISVEAWSPKCTMFVGHRVIFQWSTQDRALISVYHGNYHLVMTNIAMENPLQIEVSSWENHLFLWAMASMAMLVITRG